MGAQTFLKIDGIIGPDNGSIDVESFSWGLANPGSPCGSATGTGSGKPSFQDFSFTSQFGIQSPQLFVAAAMGKVFQSAVLTVSPNPAASTAALKVTFTNVLISSYKEVLPLGTAGPDPTAVESVSFNFAKIEVQYQDQTSSWNVCDSSAS